MDRGGPCIETDAQDLFFAEPSDGTWLSVLRITLSRIKASSHPGEFSGTLARAVTLSRVAGLRTQEAVCVAQDL